MNITGAAALNAFGARLNVQANNIANVNTDGFKKSRTDMKDVAPEGVRNTYQQIDTPGGVRIEETEQGSKAVETSNVEIAEEMPQMMVSQRGFEANLATVRTKDQMLGTLIDIVA